MSKDQAHKSLVTRVLSIFLVALIILVLWGVLLGPTGGLRYARQSAAMQQTRTIVLCLYQYAEDHGGHYPEGKTSTEVFQQLVDQQYVTDPNVFFNGYFEIPGKVKPQGNHLMAENVCFDVTCCVDSSSPDNLPIIFLTGFKINYKAGAPAIPPVRSERTWSQWWNGTSDVRTRGIAVADKDNTARWLRPADDGTIPSFIPADFDPKGKTYRQLTP